MSLVTVDRYRAITGDQATEGATVTARIERAVELLEDALDRPLASTERTERLYATRDGRLWPRATPITAAPGWEIDADAMSLYGVFGPVWPGLDGSVSATYTGGWVERTANPSATNRLPACIEEDLAFAARQLGQTAQPPIPAGATSVALGDARVTFGPRGAPMSRTGIRWSARTLGYRYRVERPA